MKKRDYSNSLFWSGFFLNIIKRFYITIPAIILLIIGIWFKPCLYIGIALAVIVLVLSLIEQLSIKKAFQTSDNPNFEEFADASSSDNWNEEVIKLVNEKAKKEIDKNE